MKYRHRKRGTEYEVIGEATAQCDRGIHDYDTVLVYRDKDTGALWIRPIEEFTKDRFEKIED